MIIDAKEPKVIPAVAEIVCSKRQIKSASIQLGEDGAPGTISYEILWCDSEGKVVDGLSSEIKSVEVPAETLNAMIAGLAEYV